MTLRKNVADMKEEVSVLKSQIEDFATVKSSFQKLKQEMLKMKILQKLSADKQDRESISESRDTDGNRIFCL